MVSRLAVLSDVHGVGPALAAVLAEPDVLAAERIVLTGDIAAGPQPEAVLDALLGLGERVVWLSGNADREIVELRRGRRNEIPDEIAMWAANRLRDDQVDFLAALPGTVRLTVDGLGEVLFCHGTPRSDEEVVLVDSSLGRWAEALEGVEEDTVVCGNTHMPFARLANGKLVVNPGSVGMPYGRPGAHWALLGPGVELRRTLFDVDTAIAEVNGCGYPGIEEWSDYFLRARATDSETLGAFRVSAGQRHQTERASVRMTGSGGGG